MVALMLLFQSFSYWITQTASDWMPRSMCVNGNPLVIGLHILSELMITGAYYSIPLILWYITRKQASLFKEYKPIFLMFALFIFLCGTTHLVGIFMFWYPIYWVDGILKFITGVVSLFTAGSLILLAPKILSIAPKEAFDRLTLEKDIAELKAKFLLDNVDIWNKEAQDRFDTFKKGEQFKDK